MVERRELDILHRILLLIGTIHQTKIFWKSSPDLWKMGSLNLGYPVPLWHPRRSSPTTPRRSERLTAVKGLIVKKFGVLQKNFDRGKKW